MDFRLSDISHASQVISISQTGSNRGKIFLSWKNQAHIDRKEGSHLPFFVLQQHVLLEPIPKCIHIRKVIKESEEVVSTARKGWKWMFLYSLDSSCSPMLGLLFSFTAPKGLLQQTSYNILQSETVFSQTLHVVGMRRELNWWGVFHPNIPLCEKQPHLGIRSLKIRQKCLPMPSEVIQYYSHPESVL